MFQSETDYLVKQLGRQPTRTELAMVSAEWSEHCSYKSSRNHIKNLYIVKNDKLDSGVIDVGGGYIITAHIESHNHPSAVDPYGGAATGVGGIIRDIISAGTRPIAILDGLSFGDIRSDKHASWLLRGAVKGISDYGNCIGIPTVSGQTDFDSGYAGYALVDVAAIGFGRRERLVRNTASSGDRILLVGGPTGYDGVGGSQFASDQLDTQDRSAVQIPDPFMEKMVLEVVMECRPHIKAVKDLGGGGLACAVSETAHSLGVGMRIDAGMVHTRDVMETHNIMVSESQERMLIISDDAGSDMIRASCAKFRVPFSDIGVVDDTGIITVRDGMGVQQACISASLLAVAPALEWPATPAPSLENDNMPAYPADMSGILLEMLGSMYCSSREYIYGQYDHEVGIRTVVRPGHGAALLRLDNGGYVAVSMDGNPRHCSMNPYHGAMGCFEEAYRNVTCVGGEPVAMLDHLQFGSPENPHVFAAFLDAIRGLGHYGRRTGIPCIGGKVSLYNETAGGPIKPSPVIMVLGMCGSRPGLVPPQNGDAVFVIGDTCTEMGGSIYNAMYGYDGGMCPGVDADVSVSNGDAVRYMVRHNMAGYVQDCSRGGLAITLSKMCMYGMVGCRVRMDAVPGSVYDAGCAMFSESHSRYVAAIPRNREGDVRGMLSETGIPHARIGYFGGDAITFGYHNDMVCDVTVDKAQHTWAGSLERMMHNG